MNSTPRAHRLAIATMILCCLLWSVAGVITRQIEQAHRFEVTFWRSFFCAVAMMIWFAMSEGRNAWPHIRRSGRAGLIAGLCWATMFTCFMLALTLTSTANTLVVNALSPLLTALMAWWILRNPIPLRTWLAILAALIGMAIMFGGALQMQDHKALIGMVIAFGVPLSAAINLITMKRSRQHVDLAPAVLLGALLSASITLPLALPFAASRWDLLFLAILGVFQLAVPCVLLIRAARHLSAPETALLGMLEVILGPLWTWLFAAEEPSPATLLGGLIVMAALVLHETWTRARAQTVS